MSSLFKAVTTPQDSKDDKPISTKSRVLVLSSRGVTYRHQQLLTDLVSMMPHARKDAKLDTKSHLHFLNEVAELYNCNGVMFFEARKRQDLYIWLARAPNGPCVKFHVENLHTMSELNFTGNALKGSRAIVSFDKNFDLTPSASLIKEMLLHTFSVPKGARKSKPFIDRVVSFTFAEGKVWMRHYQIQPITSNEEEKVVEGLEKAAKKDRSRSDKDQEGKSGKEGKDGIELIEIGPRFVMTPIVILEGSFGGPKVFENKEFISPNEMRAAVRQKRAARAGGRDMARTKRSVKKTEVQREQMAAKEGEINDATLFA